jgi:hypothetical protein
MASMHRIGLRRRLRQIASFFGMVALSALVVLLAQHLLTPPQAMAQAGQPQVVRASAFEVVAGDGTVLARLATNSSGGGYLVLNDATGTRRAEVNGRGVFNSFDTDGTTLRFRAGYLPATQFSPLPPFSGVLLDPNGAIGVLPASP